MAVDATNTTNTANTQSASSIGKTRLVESYDTFMSLLTAQIRNQDPLSPMDSTQFTQQLVQMTGVEQQLLTNDLLEKVITNTGSGIQTSVALIGKEVKAVTDEATLKGGKAAWSYELAADAAKVKVEVVNSLGKVVHSEYLTDQKAGDHSLNWNGKDKDGAQLADGGSYFLKITATDAADAAVKSTTYLKGKVTGVEQSNGNTLLTINGSKVAWGLVNSITEASASNDDSTATTDETSSKTAA